jgi:hypothetical protein
LEEDGGAEAAMRGSFDGPGMGTVRGQVGGGRHTKEA